MSLHFYFMMSNDEDSFLPNISIQTNKTRGSDLCLKKFRSKHDKRKFYFTNRVVDHWKSLLNCDVSANNITAFKKA